MRQHLARLTPALLVGGCSLIYNPSNIDKPMHDARIIDMGETPVDVEIRADAMPGDLELTEAFPPTVFEGSGTAGSRLAVVVLRGRHFVKAASGNLTVTVTPETAGAAVLDSYEVAGNGDYIALSIAAPVTMTCEDGATPINVDVTVEQNNPAGGTVMKTLDNAFTITCLDQLTAAPASADNLKAMYSVVNIAGTLDLGPATKSAIIRSASTITLGAVDVSALGAAAGPGGGTGGALGAGTTFGGNAGGTGGGPAGGKGGAANANGGGGGYATQGGAGTNGAAGGAVSGDAWIASYDTNRSSGGGGGGGALLNTDGGAGGGGGGTLELTAPGTVMVGAITANGGNGSEGSAGDGGAGTGGTVVIRSGDSLTASTITVAKGSPAPGAGGTSSDGRIRVDAATGAYPANATKGPMFVGLQPRYTVQTPQIMLRGTPNDATATLRVFDRMGNAVGGATYTPVFGTAGQDGAATATVMPVLKAGYNKICVWVAGGSPANAESINCFETAYLPL